MRPHRRAGWTIDTVDDVARPRGWRQRRRAGLAAPDVRALRTGRRARRRQARRPPCAGVVPAGQPHGATLRARPRAGRPRRRASRPGTTSRPAARRSPRTVRLDSPATRAPGKGLVVCSLEAWDEVWRRNQFLVRELLELDPNRRVLFVEPPFDWVHERRRRLRAAPTPARAATAGERRASRPVRAGQVLATASSGPRPTGRCGGRSAAASTQLGFDSIRRLWVNDPSYAGLATDAGRGRRCTTSPTTGPRRATATAPPPGPRQRGPAVRRVRAVVVCSDGLAATRRAASARTWW